MAVMRTDILVRPDRTRPAGGYALVIFPGVRQVPADTTLVIRPYDQNVSFAWPQRIMAPAQTTDEGLVLLLVPKVVRAIPTHLPVTVSLPGAGLDATLDWPDLTEALATIPQIRDTPRQLVPIRPAAASFEEDAEPDQEIEPDQGTEPGHAIEPGQQGMPEVETQADWQAYAEAPPRHDPTHEHEPAADLAVAYAHAHDETLADGHTHPHDERFTDEHAHAHDERFTDEHAHAHDAVLADDYAPAPVEGYAAPYTHGYDAGYPGQPLPAHDPIGDDTAEDWRHALADHDGGAHDANGSFLYHPQAVADDYTAPPTDIYAQQPGEIPIPDADLPHEQAGHDLAAMHAALAASKRGFGAGALFGVALLAFVLGGAAMAGLTILKPGLIGRASQETMATLPYDTLISLPTQSPRGKKLPDGDAGVYTQLGRDAAAAGDQRESAFYFSWATRRFLTTTSNGAAGILANYAKALADSSATGPGREAARFLWGLAAVAGDCKSLNNIAISLGASGADATRIAQIRKTEEACDTRLAANADSAPSH